MKIEIMNNAWPMVSSIIVYITIVKGVGKLSFALFTLSLYLSAVFCVFGGWRE